MTSILEDIFNMASLVPRIAQVIITTSIVINNHGHHQHQHGQLVIIMITMITMMTKGGASTYLESAQQHLELREMKEELTTRLTLVIEQVAIIIMTKDNGDEADV